MRRRHFPPARNLLPAHLTLFHKLPGGEEGEIAGTLADLARRQPPFGIEVSGLRLLGAGVAYDLHSPELLALRARLAALWHERLGAQDRQGFRPHITIQNKVLPAQAKALHEELSARFGPFDVEARGLLLWRYRGGPWEAAGRFPFPREVRYPSI